MLLLPLVASAQNVVEIDGIYYQLLSNKEATVTKKNGGEYIGRVVIPESVNYEGVGYIVKSIGDEAFRNCSDLTSVSIPNSVTSIGRYAFFDDSGLTSVHISDMAAWCKISFEDFYSNPLNYAHHLYLGENEIKDLVIPNSVTSIGDYAFYFCSGLTSVTIGNSVTSIGDYAFEGCSGLTSVSISNSVTSIGRGAFAVCRGLTSVTIPNSVTSIRGSAFGSCDGLTSVTIGNGVISIGENAFFGCSGLTSVTIPNSVTSIGYYAFRGCNGLNSVYISNVAAWCKISFGNEYSNPLNYAHHLYLGENEIKDLVIPNGVTSMGNWAFYGCNGLTSVSISNSVTSIGNYAFSECSGLTSVTIGNCVTSIGSYAFYNCIGMTSVVIPNSVTSIGGGTFWGCSGLTSVTIGSGVENIYSQAFAFCEELMDVYCLAENVPSTNTNAFQDSDIEYVTLHVPAASINDYKAVEPWKNFKSIVGLDGTIVETPKCATPTIALVDGKLKFSCETEDVEFVYDLKSTYSVQGVGDEVLPVCQCTVSVYATKEGWENSDAATLEFTLGTGGEVCDTNKDGVVDVADIATILSKMAGH